MRKISSQQFRDKKILHRDKEVYKSLYNVGYLTKSDILKLGMKENKLNELKQVNYLEKHIITDKATNEQIECYKISSAGREFFSEKLGIEKQYYSSRSPEHDIYLSRSYMALKEQVNFSADSWKNESECRQILKDKVADLNNREWTKLTQAEQKIVNQYEQGKLSPVDGMLSLSNGDNIAIEITTNRYSEEDIQQKEDFSSAIGASVEMIKAY